MRENLLNKLSMIITIFSFVLLLQFVVFTFEGRIDDKITDINNLQEKIDNYYIPQEDQYEDSIRRIVTYIQTTDQYLNIGGFVRSSNSTPEYIDSNLFDSIINRNNEEDFSRLLTNVETFFNERNEYLDTLPSIWPIEYSPHLRITSPFGKRYSPFTDKIVDHGGIDMASTWGADILATAPGVVEEHWIYEPTFGKYIIINHGNGYRTHYAHLSVSYIHEGYEIERGQVIGRMGNSGLSRGMHLHYAISKFNEELEEWEFIDPISFMREVIHE